MDELFHVGKDVERVPIRLRGNPAFSGFGELLQLFARQIQQMRNIGHVPELRIGATIHEIEIQYLGAQTLFTFTRIIAHVILPRVAYAN